MNIAALLPDYVDATFVGEHKLSSTMVALIVCMFEIAYILSAPLIGATL